MQLGRRMAAEAVGTFWLVFGGCGSAVLAAAFPDVGIGLLGVALAFGLTVLTMAYAIGHVSGCHLNPAVTVGLWSGGRFPAKDIAPYVLAQVVGAIVAAGLLYVVASGTASYDIATNGLAGERLRRPVAGQVLDERGAGDRDRADRDVPRGDPRFDRYPAPRPGSRRSRSGSALTLIHLISIPVTNTSVNPARSTGPALIVGGLALQQLWLFWVRAARRRGLGGSATRCCSRTRPKPDVAGGAQA
jgi:aquaporin Z